MRIAIIFLLTTILFGTSCTKEHDMVHIEEEPFVPITNIEIESLVISIGEDIPFSCLINNQVYMSEGGGVLLIEKLLLDQLGNSVFIQSDGYYNEIRYIIPTLNANLNLEVTLTSLTPIGGITNEIEGFNASEGGVVDAYKTIITFEPNTIVNEEGDLFEGEVKVYANSTYRAAYLNVIRRFPHNSFVENRKQKSLNIIGGHNLLLRDEMMNPLYLKEGSSANIKFEVIASSGIITPDVLKLMAYDAENDTWISMGNAEKEGEEWIGNINHLGIIAWGIEHETLIAQIKLVTNEGVIAPNKFVWVYTDQEIPFSLSFSDSHGNVKIHVPVHEEYGIWTIENRAPDFILKKEFPISGKGNGELIMLDDLVLTSEIYQVFSGSVVDCNSDIILNSAVLGKGSAEFGKSNHDAYVFSDENGMFNFALPRVSTDQIPIKAYDFDSRQTSQEYLLDNTDEGDIDFGDLLVCE